MASLQLNTFTSSALRIQLVMAGQSGTDGGRLGSPERISDVIGSPELKAAQERITFLRDQLASAGDPSSELFNTGALTKNASDLASAGEHLTAIKDAI